MEKIASEMETLKKAGAVANEMLADAKGELERARETSRDGEKLAAEAAAEAAAAASASATTIAELRAALETTGGSRQRAMEELSRLRDDATTAKEE